MATPAEDRTSAADQGSARIRLSYVGQLRRRMGCASEELVLERPVTVRHVLDRLVETHGEDLLDVFYNQYGWLDPRLFFLIDGEGATSRGGLDAEVGDARELTLLLGIPMSGG
jgi:hypothetical protein